MIKLKPRLSITASMVRQNSRIADVGTDHAYLPAFLILNGMAESAIASDLRTGPLENAKSTVKAYGLEKKVELRLSDGLECICSDEVDDVVIAGMGGILISEILEKSNGFMRENLKFIFQPQSHDEVLRKWLFDNGFEILEEKSCFEDEKVYIAMSAAYTGKISSHGQAEIMFGNYPSLSDESSKAFVNKKLKRIHTRINALEKTETQADELELLKEIVLEIEHG
ncbi:MAG: SAM-dependent methyltransferase [Ruminococcus sp.]|nr:SAM-dependent methyltransferase [Candidatus Copronaster equi]